MYVPYGTPLNGHLDERSVHHARGSAAEGPCLPAQTCPAACVPGVDTIHHRNCCQSPRPSALVACPPSLTTKNHGGTTIALVVPTTSFSNHDDDTPLLLGR